MLPGTTGGVTAVSRTLSMEGCMELSLSRKITCITGGSRGIGFATARTFAAEGARVIVCGRGRERLDAAVDRIKKETGRRHRSPDRADRREIRPPRCPGE
jgi:NAD(P)-dependent dehydrogenase (short-subunit alcohol dehydrogenase family)